MVFQFGPRSGRDSKEVSRGLPLLCAAVSETFQPDSGTISQL